MWGRFRSKLPRRQLGPDGQLKPLVDPGVVAIFAAVVLNPVLLALLVIYLGERVFPHRSDVPMQAGLLTFLVALCVISGLALYAIGSGIRARDGQRTFWGGLALLIVLVVPVILLASISTVARGIGALRWGA